MATIKAIEARSVHQIQSGQVIVDLCSVAKELVENSLDAGATSIEVRFKNSGLDAIEVQDNGSGISRDNYENIALKHYTSKLSSFDDLSRLNTFGFRGEALSSLCALADFHIVTAQAHEAPKANRLEFEPSGKLKRTQIVAGQKGTTASVEGIFKRLPVRRRELEKNIKREYGKVLNLLHAYACVSTGVRFSVKNTVGKTRNVVVFSTKGNPTTKENIANVYGAKTLLALIPLDLTLEFEPSVAGRRASAGEALNQIRVRGHVSRPVFGEGRQTPDRQMFFVNSRPCGLPQIAKAFNEVYKSFNVSQSPFVFADFHMDTNAYDVNVSPDKRTILLHDAGALIESLKTSLTEVFESADQTVPQSQVSGAKQPGSKPNSTLFQSFLASKHAPEETPADGDGSGVADEIGSSQASSHGRMKSFLSDLGSRPGQADTKSTPAHVDTSTQESQPMSPPTVSQDDAETEVEVRTPAQETNAFREAIPEEGIYEPDEDITEPRPGLDEGETNVPPSSAPSSQELSTHGLDSSMETQNVVQNAFDRMRPRRAPAEVATITIGNKIITSMVGSGVPRKRDAATVGMSNTTSRKRRIHTPSRPNIFGKHMRDFAAPGSQMQADDDSEEGAEDEPESQQGDDAVSEEEIEEPDDGFQSYAPSDDHGVPDNTPPEPQEGEASDEEQEVENLPPPVETNMGEEEKKKHDEAEVQRLIQQAEEQASLPQGNNVNRANKMNKGAYHRDSTVQLVSTMDGSVSRVQSLMEKLQESARLPGKIGGNEEDATGSQETAEERLSLTVSKDDFAQMRIIGQFNLGFILATRSSKDHSNSAISASKDELFIIDQHASDEKFNFERLQAETVVQNQRLVQPKRLDLTAVEEEIVIENQAALEKNGFIVEVDDSGDEPIGRRCKLVSLPLSKEVVFGVRDLEELIVLLSEMPATGTTGGASDRYVPRPSKVRKMFAMRACRSSIMIGKTLTTKQMERVVRNMGTIDKPWNCPHGRPTMRHLMSLGQWNEWDEFAANYDDREADDDRTDGLEVWRDYFNEMAPDDEDDDDQVEL
jgi:DNA mismatch repair protein PMS2